jgi:ribosome biogenesis GTPase
MRGNAAGAFAIMSSAYEHAGFDARFASQFAPHEALGRVPARVARVDRDRIVLFVPSAAAPVPARASGRLRHEAVTAADLPAVGDWVAATLPATTGGGDAVVHAVLPRQTCFARKAAGRAADEQVAAANVDTVFLVAGLDGDYNPRRIERYLVAARASGARAVVVLNKADLLLRESPAAYATRLAEVEELAGGAPVHAVSALAGNGLEALATYLAPGQTVALLGSSGVGKSTLVNALAGEARQDTGAVRAADSRGRHTTTHRELVALAGGAWLVDTPGMRELGLASGDGAGGEAGDGLEATFDDVEELARACRFGDCGHAAEPGCAVRAGLASGALPEARYASWIKLGRELRAYAARHDKRLAAEQKARWKAIHVANRNRPPKGARW